MAITVRLASPEVMAMQEWEFPKRKRGRPKGSKNKPKAPQAATERASPKPASIPPSPSPPASQAEAENDPNEWRATFFLSAALFDRFGEFVYRVACEEIGIEYWPPDWNCECRAVELRFLCERIDRDY